MDGIIKREPTQARSQQRRDRILRATGELLGEMDYAAVNVAAIAERADTSVGSIYQFFQNKDAILYALAEIYLDDMRDSMAAAFGMAGQEIASQVDCVMNWVREYAETHPGFHHVLKSEWVSPDIRAAVAALHGHMADSIGALIGSAAPHLDLETRRIAAEVSLGITDGVLPHIIAATGDHKRRLLVELRRALTGYLQNVIHTYDGE